MRHPQTGRVSRTGAGRGLLALALCFGLSLGVRGEQRTHVAYRLARAPVLDGAVEGDPAWAGLPVAGRFTIPGVRIPAAEQTSFRLGYTAEAMFIAVVCEEKDGGERRKRVETAKREKWSPWRLDSVEIFLHPPGSEKYYQFMTNVRRDQVNLLCTSYYRKVPLEKWRAELREGRDGWSVEIMIPYGMFEGTPLPAPAEGQVWTGNVCRNNFNSTGDRGSCWAFFKATRFHTPEDFGRIVFAGPHSRAEARAVERRLVDRFYRDELVAAAAELARRETDIAGIPGADPGLTAPCQALRRTCAEIKRSVARLEELSLQEVAALFARLRHALREADRLKARILLAKHFPGNGGAP